MFDLEVFGTLSTARWWYDGITIRCVQFVRVALSVLLAHNRSQASNVSTRTSIG